MKDLLQGKPLRHPLHPALAHFPVGLWVLSLLFDLATLLLGAGNPLVRGAFYTLVGGLIMAVVAAIPGLVDWTDIRADHPAKRLATYHMVLNLAAIALYAINAGLRYGDLEQGSTPVLPLVLSFLGIGIISVSGYLGGIMVYDDGIGVGRHRRATDPPRDTIHTPADNGFVEVATSDKLREGHTLRAEVNGNVIAVANIDGDYYAFQEFCTHRYGPLSEGSFTDHQVECPWHRSCFDVRTGKVTQGPAKVDLKTFEVQVRDGKILVNAPREGS
jgi:nitrite reductase/ring-hydroxylating ferredoxin subunit/uncharacterized membrane protein